MKPYQGANISIAILNYLLIGLALACLIPDGDDDKIKHLSDWALPLICFSLLIFCPMAKNFLRVFSLRTAHFFSLGLILFLSPCQYIGFLDILALFILPFAIVLLLQSTQNLCMQIKLPRFLPVAWIFVPLGILLGISMVEFCAAWLLFWSIPFLALATLIQQIRCPALDWSTGLNNQPETCPKTADGIVGLLFASAFFTPVIAISLIITTFSIRNDTWFAILFILGTASPIVLPLFFDACFDHSKAIIKNIIHTKKRWMFAMSCLLAVLQGYAFFGTFANTTTSYEKLAGYCIALILGAVAQQLWNRIAKGYPTLLLGIIVCLLAPLFPNYPLLLISAILLSGSSSAFFLRFTAEQDIHTRSTLNCYYHMILAIALLAIIFLNS